MASGTSFALPRPTPTWPAPSPTTTSAEKLNRRPPFTTLATRLMWTTLSWSSSSFALMGVAIRNLESLSVRLELEPGFARGGGHRLDAAVVVEPVAVEHDLLDPLRLGRLGEGLADLLGGGGLVVLLDLVLHGL